MPCEVGQSFSVSCENPILHKFHFLIILTHRHKYLISARMTDCLLQSCVEQEEPKLVYTLFCCVHPLLPCSTLASRSYSSKRC